MGCLSLYRARPYTSLKTHKHHRAEGGWRTGTAAGPVRQTLIEKGLIYAPDRGPVDFTVPSFGDFMRRTHPLSSLLEPPR
jgi:hypothetical protein